jgi:hypothetical protein
MYAPKVAELAAFVGIEWADRKHASMRLLRELIEQRRTRVDDVRRLTSRITDALKRHGSPLLN